MTDLQFEFQSAPSDEFGLQQTPAPEIFSGYFRKRFPQTTATQKPQSF
jgi:hypothetical protein